ncbi:flagellar hook-length control protein FliK [Candidatus Latescibacterota bacterium]
MKIIGPEAGSGDKIPASRLTEINRKMPLNTGIRSHDSSFPGDRLIKHLSAFFAKRAMDISPAQLKALYTELSALGLNTHEIDDTNILNALMLQRYSIPLSKELLETFRGNVPAIFRGISSLREDALSLLGDSRLTGENRIAVETLLQEINAFFRGTVSQESRTFVITDFINLWMYDLESNIKYLAEIDAESNTEYLRGMINADFNEVETAFESLLRTSPGKKMSGETEKLITALKTATKEFIVKVNEIDSGIQSASEKLKEAVESLRIKLASAVGEYKSANILSSESIRMSALTPELLYELLSERIRILENGLLARIPGSELGGEVTGNANAVMKAVPLKNIVQNSGMAFEWQLLAWYRAGRDPERLRTLMKEDLKGILLNFANRTKRNPVKGNIKKKFELLGKNTQTQMNNIRNLQLSNILGKHGLKKGFYFELPPSVVLNYGHGVIEDAGHNGQEKRKTAENRNSFALEIDVETSKIGNVHVSMTFSGKAVSLHFGLESETVSNRAKDMSQELRANLTEQGYTVISVDFHRRDYIGGQPSNSLKSKRNGRPEKNLDITG